MMDEASEAIGTAMVASPVTRQATAIVARDQAVAYLVWNAWADSAGLNGYYAIDSALHESAALVRGDHFVNFVSGSGMMSVNNINNMRLIRDTHSPLAEQYTDYATAAGTQPDTASAATFALLATDHGNMQVYVDRMFGALATNRWPAPVTITQSELIAGSPIATGQALANAWLIAGREAYFTALCGVGAQYARMAQKEAMARGLLAFAAVSSGDYWHRLGMLTGVVAVDDYANLVSAMMMATELETSYTSLAAVATTAGDIGFASMVTAKLSDVRAIVRRLQALQLA
jgi:hypothetical protein